MKKTGNEYGHTIRQRYILDAVRYYEKKYPKEAAEAKRSVKSKRDSRANIYGSDSSKEMRFALRLPERLFRSLSQLDNPPFLHEDREFNWFIRTFPDYSVTKKA